MVGDSKDDASVPLVEMISDGGMKDVGAAYTHGIPLTSAKEIVHDDPNPARSSSTAPHDSRKSLRKVSDNAVLPQKNRSTAPTRDVLLKLLQASGWRGSNRPKAALAKIAIARGIIPTTITYPSHDEIREPLQTTPVADGPETVVISHHSSASGKMKRSTNNILSAKGCNRTGGAPATMNPEISMQGRVSRATLLARLRAHGWKGTTPTKAKLVEIATEMGLCDTGGGAAVPAAAANADALYRGKSNRRDEGGGRCQRRQSA